MLDKGRREMGQAGIAPGIGDLSNIHLAFFQKLSASFQALELEIAKDRSSKNLAKSPFELCIVQPDLQGQVQQRGGIFHVGNQNPLGIMDTFNVVRA